ncbi:MAG: hypothetical protein JSS67_10370 [Bacteroidetes bacterium]|nr:hypothetical protein [Bacteroidota bacterium]
MQQYQLLRDNKETGPYTASALIEKGLKPYDLIWATGKTAAWQYPSELEELKAYAPIVEEQPFDRFYKKPQIKKVVIAVEENVTVSNEKATEVEPIEVEPIIEQPVAKPRIRIRADWKRIEANPAEVPVEKTTSPIEKNNDLVHHDHSNTPGWQSVLSDWEKNKQQDAPKYDQKTNVLQSTSTGFYNQHEQEEGGVLFNNKQKSNFLKSNRAAISIAASFILLLGGGYLVSGYIQNKNVVPAKVSQTIVPKNDAATIPQNEPTQKSNETVSTNQENTLAKATVLTVPVQNTNATNNTQLIKVTQNIPAQPINNSLNNVKTSNKNIVSKQSNPNIPVTKSTASIVKNVATNNENISSAKEASTNLNARTPSDNSAIKNYIQIQPSRENINGVVNYQYQVSNISQTKLDLVMIDLQYFDEAGKFQKGQTVYVKNLAPDQAVVVSPPEAQQAAKITCKVSMVSASQKNLYLIAD